MQKGKYLFGISKHLDHYFFFILLTIKWDIAIVIATVNLKFVFMNGDFLNSERELSLSIGLCSIFQLPFSLILA